MNHSLHYSRKFSRLCLAATAAGGLFFAVAIPPASADVNDIADIFLIKAQENRQTSPADPLAITNPFSFQVGANPRAVNSILSAAFQSPAAPFRNMDPLGGGNFYFFGGSFATLAALNAAFPSGTYNFAFQTVTPPTGYNTPVLFTGDNYPSTVPKILNTEWVSGALQIDSTNDFVFACNIFSPFATNGDSEIGIQIFDAANNLVFSISAITPTTSFTMPANTLQENQYYNAVLAFVNRTTTILGTTTTAIANYQVRTDFKIATISGIPVLSSPSFIQGTVGQPFYYQIVATNHPFSYSADPLPPGLTFDSTTGIINGTPTSSGQTSVTLQAQNSVGVGFNQVSPDIQSAPPAGPIIVSSTCALGYTGRPFTFKVSTQRATIAARVTQTGLPNGLNLDAGTGVISGTTTFAGSTLVNLTVNDGSFTATGSLELTFTADAGYPVITNANTVTVQRGRPFSYTIATPGADPTDPLVLSYLGTLPQGLSFDPATGTISGIYPGPLLEGRPSKLTTGRARPIGGLELAGGIIGIIQLFGTNLHGTSTFQLIFLAAPSGLTQISTRLPIGTGNDVLIGGFIIGADPTNADAQKGVIIRAIGPSLADFGISGALADPVLELHGATGALIALNDDWRSGGQEQTIIETHVPPSDDRESAIVGGLDPGNYTAIVRGKNDTTGIALVEVYDLGTASLDPGNIRTQLKEISTRGNVLTGDNVMIGGFIVEVVTIRTLLRAIGPSLSAFGIANALQDTTLELHDGNGATIAMNDNWRSDQEQAIIDTGAPPTDDRESAIVTNLVPGAYTAVVRGKNNTTGVALVEVYALQ